MRVERAVLLVLMPVLLFTGSALMARAPGQAEASPLGDLKPGPYAVGFRLTAVIDESRTFNASLQVRGLPSAAERARTVRVYQWYPATAVKGAPLRLGDYVRLAEEDFGQVEGGKAVSDAVLPLPVPLTKGLSEEARGRLLAQPMAAHADATAARGRFPLVVIGQGLYYESPLSQVVVAEFLASQGYVVATCPLLGTFDRLVTLSAVDLETEVRDMEFVIAQVRGLPNVDRDRLGILGYDLGGMAGLLLCMRNPQVGAFASLDSGILEPHFSGLPQSSPHYSESRFAIPWLHATQARFVSTGSEAEKKRPLWEHKAFGDSFLLRVNSTSHGDFSSYAAFGLGGPIPGYWGPVQGDPRKRHEMICQYVARFFDAYLKKDQNARDFLRRDVKQAGLEEVLNSVEFKAGPAAPPLAEDYLQDIILHGTAEALPKIRKEMASGKSAVAWDEKALNWLGYHFLYWWGREKEAVELFQFATELFPDSADAFDSLGEAHMLLGEKERATESYRKSLQLDPKNENARRMLERLEKE